MTARREPHYSYRHLRNAHSHCHALENCPLLPLLPRRNVGETRKGRGEKNEGEHAPLFSLLNSFACVFFSNLISRPSDIQPRRVLFVDFTLFFFLFEDNGHDDASIKSFDNCDCRKKTFAKKYLYFFITNKLQPQHCANTKFVQLFLK